MATSTATTEYPILEQCHKRYMVYALGDARKTHLRLKKGEKVIIWLVTLANITPAYGDSGAPNGGKQTMAYQARKGERFEEILELVDEKGNVVICLRPYLKRKTSIRQKF